MYSFSGLVVQYGPVFEVELAFAAHDVYLALFEAWHPDKDTLYFVGHDGFDQDGVVQEACVYGGFSA